MSAFGFLPNVAVSTLGLRVTGHQVYLLLHVLGAILRVGTGVGMAVLGGRVAAALVARLDTARIQAPAAAIGVS